MKIQFERMFKDGEDWHPVDEKQVRAILDGYYKDVDLAIEDLRSGVTLDTLFALYRVKPEGKGCHT